MTELWAILIPGPDDLIAFPSKEAAEQAAKYHNEYVYSDRWPLPDRKDFYCAEVVAWPHGARSHAIELAKQKENH